MEVDPDIESSGLLDGLEEKERAERAELVAWLLEKGFTVEEIQGSFAPMLLASRRLIGDDGTYVSTRDIAEQAGVDIDMVRRIQRAIGLPTDDDPDEAVYLRADGEAVLHTAKFLKLGFDADQLLQVDQEPRRGAVEYRRDDALHRPGERNTPWRNGTRDGRRVLRWWCAAAAPLLGPMIEDMLLLQLRHALETEAVNASERASGKPLPGAREIAVAFADMVDFTRLGEAVEPEKLEQLAHRLATMARDVAVPPVRFVKTIGDAVMLVLPRAGSAAERDAPTGRRRRG